MADIMKEALNELIKKLEDCKIDNSCIVMVPGIGNYDVYKLPFEVVQTAMKLYEISQINKDLKNEI